jgi:mannosyltransferase OCH1-like enzyme
MLKRRSTRKKSNLRRRSRKSKRSRRSTHRNIPKTLGGIPKIIHQIWIGSDIPSHINSLYINTCKNIRGWEHRLWTNNDLTEQNFPLTYKYIQRILEVGKELGSVTKKYAQVSDLMRLEILYRNGGVYIDTTAECLKNLDGILDYEDVKFAVSNEDPCGFDCQNDDGDPYISNSFIASTKYNKIIKEILTPKNLDNIDLYSHRVNHQTGPYFLGKNLLKLKRKFSVIMLPMDYIYPHGYKGVYRKTNAFDKCFHYSRKPNSNLDLTNVRGEKIYLEYPCKSYPKSYVVKHWEAGGTWI